MPPSGRWPLGAGLAVSAGRASADFTLFDGNVEIAVGTHDMQRILQSVRRISASAMESWATCPFPPLELSSPTLP